MDQDMTLGSLVHDTKLLVILNADREKTMREYGTSGEYFMVRVGWSVYMYDGPGHWRLHAL